MNSDQRKDRNWREYEDISDAVRRLTAMIDERNAKRRLAGGQNGPAEIRDRPKSPGEKAGDEESTGSGMLNPHRQQLTDSREDVAGGLVKGGGQTDLQCVRFSYGSKRAACPVSGSPLLPAERARNAPESEIE
jgi:hypothetical protein